MTTTFESLKATNKGLADFIEECFKDIKEAVEYNEVGAEDEKTHEVEEDFKYNDIIVTIGFRYSATARRVEGTIGEYWTEYNAELEDITFVRYDDNTDIIEVTEY